MGIGKEFLKPDKMYTSVDEIINVIIDNGPEIMRIHNMIQRQNAEFNHAREVAHIEIQQIRQTLENLKIASGVSKKELISLQKRKDELIQIRDGNHPIIDDRTGEPLRMTPLVHIVVNHPALIKQLEKGVKVKNTVLEWVICKPLRKAIKYALTKTNNQEATKSLMDIYERLVV